MQQFDITLKMLLRGRSSVLVKTLGGGRVVRWLEVENLKVESSQVDRLCMVEGGGLVHMELQSTNYKDMPARMAEYALAVRRRFRKMPRQVVLYVGRTPMRMATEFREGRMTHEYEIIDFRKLDAQPFLDSPDVGDNVVAVLGRLRDQRAAVAKIIARIGRLQGSEREAAVAQLCILAGLRGLEETVKEEVERMPIVVDLMKNKVYAESYRRAVSEAKSEGEVEGERNLLRHLIATRFGQIPQWVDERLDRTTGDELKNLSQRLFDAHSLNELLA